jgi:thiamine-phosphate pyrophosphorylase
MTSPRLFLVAPGISSSDILACVDAASKVGDVASVLIPPEQLSGIVKPIQALGIAVLTSGDPGHATRNTCDGIHIDAGRDAFEQARSTVGKDRFVGAYCAASRHDAMEMAEAGVDYVAFSQNLRAAGGVPIVGWWSEMFEVPCVAFDPVEAKDLDTLLPQNPDFIRPSDAMWASPEAAGQIVASLANRMKP